MRKIFTAFLLLCATVTHAETSAGFTYKGVKIGDPADSVPARLPAYSCRVGECEYSMRQCVEKMSRDQCDGSASFGGAWVRSGTVKLTNGAVSEIFLLFTPDVAAEAANAATQAFGPPATSEVKDLQTRGGARFASWEKQWKSGDQTLTIRQHAGDVGTGMAHITSAETKAAQEQARKLKAAKGAGDF